MPLKKTSEVFTISNIATQTAIDGFLQVQLSMPLNVLDQEVLAIYAVDFDLGQPDADVSQATQNVRCSLTATSQTGDVGINNSSCIAAGKLERKNDTGAALLGNTISSFNMAQTPTGTDIPYIYLLATDDMFLQIDSSNAGSVQSCKVRIWAQRLRADAATYAALVQSELAGQ